MIKTLDNTQEHIAQEMREVFMASYSVEAELLKATDFPPLKRKLSEYMDCPSVFYGFFEETTLAGVIEIKAKPEFFHIQSLVVHPDHFRKGIGSQLIKRAIQKAPANDWMVETGVDNIPAIRLYERFGFQEVLQFDTSIGIRKVRMFRK